MVKKVIACEVIKEELLALGNYEDVEFEFVSMGLHNYPDKLKVELQRLIDSSVNCEVVILGFGLCGQGAEGLKAVNCPIVIPRVHECIPFIIGSKERYQEIKGNQQGTYFLSGGWAEGEKNLLFEHRRVKEKYGEKKAGNVLKMMFDSYEDMNFINTTHPRNQQAKELAKEAAQLIGLTYKETNWKEDYLRKLMDGPWDEENFIYIPTGNVINYRQFN
jgi:hypothetical protein